MPTLTEIELTFLAKHIPVQVKSVKPQLLKDIYVPEDSDFAVVRLRQSDHSYEITKKTPVRSGDFSSHVEQTIPLTKEEFEALSRSSGRSVEKMRYRVVIEGHAAEVDIFGGQLEGLVVIDFEFESKNGQNSFTMPDFCLADVTQEHFILGGQLAGKSYAQIEPDLKKFNYRKLKPA